MILAMAVSEMGVMPNWNGLKREGRRKLEAEVQAFLWRSMLKGYVRNREGFLEGKKYNSILS